jgi:hypothetical protein
MCCERGPKRPGPSASFMQLQTGSGRCDATESGNHPCRPRTIGEGPAVDNCRQLGKEPQRTTKGNENATALPVTASRSLVSTWYSPLGMLSKV